MFGQSWRLYGRSLIQKMSLAQFPVFPMYLFDFQHIDFEKKLWIVSNFASNIKGIISGIIEVN